MRFYENEREGQIDFLKTFNIPYEKEDVLLNNTDGVWKGNLLEFKLNINDLNKTLFQTIKYLSRMRVKGVSVPANILLISLNDRVCYLFYSQDYFEEIHQIYYGAPSKNNNSFSAKKYARKIDFSNMVGQAELLDVLKEENFMPIKIDENCIVGWATRYYKENPNAKKGDFLGDTEGKVKIIGEIREPKHFKGLILPYSGKTNEKFKYLMDVLNDTLNKKNLGAFYTPELYCKKAAELLRQAIQRVPEGNDYIILDRCAGTGNLEDVLTEEELSHCVLSTYEYYEYKVLCERLSDKVRLIIPPVEMEDTYDRGFVRNANALTKEYVENELIQKYIKDEKCTIILYENPPYSETTSIEHQKANESKSSSEWKNNFVVKEMKKVVKGATSNDMANAFIWSAFRYYLRQPTDSYIVFSPVKYWKSQHLINKKFINGFAFNKKHFHTKTPSCVMVALWSNEDDSETNRIMLKAYDILNNELKFVSNLDVVKTYSSYSDFYYDKRKNDRDENTGILTKLNGLENLNEKQWRIPAIFNEDIIGYLVAHGSVLDQSSTNSSLLVAGRYDGNGFYLRKDNYLEKLPMFAGTRYIKYNPQWIDCGRIMKSADGVEKYLNDVKDGKLNQQLLKVLLFCVLERQNHMRSFVGSDGRFYRNELCLDTTNGDTIASEDLKRLKLGKKEKELIDLWNKILEEAKKTKKYDNSLTYGFFQIDEELNTYQTVTLNKEKKNVYDYPVLNGDIQTMKDLIKIYYLEEIAPFLFEYEFLK